MEIDIEQLRSELMHYFGAAMATGSPFATPELFEVETASPTELLRIAEREGINISRFEV